MPGERPPLRALTSCRPSHPYGGAKNSRRFRSSVIVPGSRTSAEVAPPRPRPIVFTPAVSPPSPRRVVRPQLRALTSFRFFACLAVFLHHCVDFTSSGRHSHDSGLNRLFWEGWSGVSFFFVLSGFILAYNYADRLTNTERPALRGFYVSRIARIYPLYILTFLIAAVAVMGEWLRVGVAGAATAVSQVTLTQAFLPIRDPFDPSRLAALGFDGPAWSLSCEAFFYLSFPFVLLVLARRRTPLLAAVAVGVWAWTVLLALNLQGSPLAGWALYIFPPVRLAEFVVGVCGGLIFLRCRDRLRGGPGWWTAGEGACPGIAGGCGRVVVGGARGASVCELLPAVLRVHDPGVRRRARPHLTAPAGLVAGVPGRDLVCLLPAARPGDAAGRVPGAVLGRDPFDPGLGRHPRGHADAQRHDLRGL